MIDKIKDLYGKNISEEEALESFKELSDEELESFVKENALPNESVNSYFSNEEEVPSEDLRKRAKEYTRHKNAIYNNVVELWGAVSSGVESRIVLRKKWGNQIRTDIAYVENLQILLKTSESKTLAWLQDEEVLGSIKAHYDETDASNISEEEVCAEISSFVLDQILDGFAFSNDFIAEEDYILQNIKNKVIFYHASIGTHLSASVASYLDKDRKKRVVFTVEEANPREPLVWRELVAQTSNVGLGRFEVGIRPTFAEETSGMFGPLRDYTESELKAFEGKS